MKKINYILWYFPLCFFVFLAIYLSFKFIFIYFFRAAFEPTFMFDLTPYYTLSGVNNLHLILLSLIVVWFNVYFHVKLNKKNLMFSFLPTGIMLAGLGVRITIGDSTTSSILHYIVFGCLLVIALIDHKNFLMFPETIVTPREEPVIPKAVLRKPTIAKSEFQATRAPTSDKHVRIEGIDEILTIHKETLSGLKTLIGDNLQRAEAMMKDLERKTKKIDRLGEKIEERRKNLVQDERLFRRRFISPLDKYTNVKSIKNDNGLTFDVKTRDETSNQNTMLDDFPGCAAIVKRGILKKVNRSFAELLGYNTEELLNKSLLDFIVQEGLSGIEKHYIDRLKGKSVSSFETVFLTKDNNKLTAKVSIMPTIFNGEKAEIAVVRNLEHIN